MANRKFNFDETPPPAVRQRPVKPQPRATQALAEKRDSFFKQLASTERLNAGFEALGSVASGTAYLRLKLSNGETVYLAAGLVGEQRAVMTPSGYVFRVEFQRRLSGDRWEEVYQVMPPEKYES